VEEDREREGIRMGQREVPPVGRKRRGAREKKQRRRRKGILPRTYAQF
jgi:hypothetical protein